MGEQLRHEFSMSPVDTGVRTPDVPIPGAPQSPLGNEQLGIPAGLGPATPTFIPGMAVTRPSFLQRFLANLSPALGASFAAAGPDGSQNFGSGFAGGIAGIQSYQQRQFERAQQIMAQQRLAAQQASEQALQGAQTANLNQEMRNRQRVADYFSAPVPSQPGVVGATSDNSALPFTAGGAPTATANIVGAVPQAQPPQSAFMQDAAQQRQALGTLGPDEEARFGSAVSLAARTQNPQVLNDAIAKIVEDRKALDKEAEVKRHNVAMEQNQAERPQTHTVETGKGVFAYNPKTERYDIYIGPPKPRPDPGDARSDRSYQYNNNELNKLSDPVTQGRARVGRLQETLAQNSPQADALVAPELLSIMAGGAGSGLRMNEAEISRIVGGRSQWESLKAAANKWSLDPSKANSITPEQRTQIRALVDAVDKKLAAKQTLLNGAYNDLNGTDDVKQHRAIVTRARDGLMNIDSGGQGSTGKTGGGDFWSQFPEHK